MATQPADMRDDRRILVAYGSKHGATAEIAGAIGDELRAAGRQVDVRAARNVDGLDDYRAVVLGSAVYAGRWRRDALRLLKRPELRDKDVWLFSSGPVGEVTADNQDERWTRPAKVERAAERIGAQEHVVFGGAITEEGFLRGRMARKIPPELRDLRDWAGIEAWARGISASLDTGSARSIGEQELPG